jgi:uroporphyrinogen decarboxylase
MLVTSLLVHPLLFPNLTLLKQHTFTEAMKFSLAAAALCLAFDASNAFTTSQGSSHGARLAHLASASTTESAAATSAEGDKTQAPLLIRAARGEKVERTPVWMMRQAGRHIKEYRDLCTKYPTFRQRSEIPEVAVEVSLQPWRNYKTDGCILFSDILTPLPGMGAEFVIDEKLGPIMTPMRTYDDVKKVSCDSLLFMICESNL